jgi:hypothetical protein
MRSVLGGARVARELRGFSMIELLVVGLLGSFILLTAYGVLERGSDDARDLAGDVRAPSATSVHARN